MHQVGAKVPGALAIGTDGKLRYASFSLRAGEILGIAGLQGMGQMRLSLAVFGDRPLKRGHLTVSGAKVVFTTPCDAISAPIGISLVSEERKTDGLFLHLTGTHNATIPIVDRVTKFGLIDRENESEVMCQVFSRINVAECAQVGAFSGGNQRKIAMAKWPLIEARVLLVYDQTRGIDVGTKREIYQLLRLYAEAGCAVLFYSTEILKLVQLFDHTLVILAGDIVAELVGDALTAENNLPSAPSSMPASKPMTMAI